MPSLVASRRIAGEAARCSCNPHQSAPTVPRDLHAHADLLRGTAEVTVRQCLAWAAVTGYRQECFTDDARPDGVEAAPGFQACLEWRVHGQARHLDALGLSAADQSRAAHAWLDSRLFAPIRSSCSVQIQGALLDSRVVRGHLRVTLRYRTSDLATGELLAETHTCTAFRDVVHGALEGNERPLEPPAGVLPGADARREPIVLDSMFTHLYTECSGIWNPVHTERAAAHAAGLPEPIVHGSAIWALAARRLTEAHRPTGSGHCRRMFARFRRPVAVGSTLELRHQFVKGGADYVVDSPAGAAVVGRVEW